MIESSEKNLPPKKRATSKLQPEEETTPPLPETLGAKPKQPNLLSDQQGMEAHGKLEPKLEPKEEFSSVRSSPDMLSRSPSPRGDLCYQSSYPYQPAAPFYPPNEHKENWQRLPSWLRDLELARKAQMSLRIVQLNNMTSTLVRPAGDHIFQEIIFPVVPPSQAPDPNLSLYNGPRLPVTGALRGLSPSTEEGWTGGDVLSRYRHSSGGSELSIDVVNEDDPSDGGYGSASLKLSNISKQDAFQDKKNIVKSHPQRRGSYEGPRKKFEGSEKS